MDLAPPKHIPAIEKKLTSPWRPLNSRGSRTIDTLKVITIRFQLANSVIRIAVQNCTTSYSSVHRTAVHTFETTIQKGYFSKNALLCSVAGFRFLHSLAVSSPDFSKIHLQNRHHMDSYSNNISQAYLATKNFDVDLLGGEISKKCPSLTLQFNWVTHTHNGLQLCGTQVQYDHKDKQPTWSGKEFVEGRGADKDQNNAKISFARTIFQVFFSFSPFLLSCLEEGPNPSPSQNSPYEICATKTNQPLIQHTPSEQKKKKSSGVVQFCTSKEGWKLN